VPWDWDGSAWYKVSQHKGHTENNQPSIVVCASSSVNIDNIELEHNLFCVVVKFWNLNTYWKFILWIHLIFSTQILKTGICTFLYVLLQKYWPMTKINRWAYCLIITSDKCKIIAQVVFCWQLRVFHLPLRVALHHMTRCIVGIPIWQQSRRKAKSSSWKRGQGSAVLPK